MKEKILDNIRKHNLINNNDKIVVGFSGGKDSTFLLFNLLSIKDIYKFEIVCAHLNHGVRGAEAKRDEDFCRSLCKELGIEFYSKVADMNEYAKINKLSPEEAGRNLRKEFFKEVLIKSSSNKIALAHNFNDQVETLLMRIFRGTGLEGLKGVEYRTGNIIRPILNIKRAEIDKYIEENHIPFVQDSTNFENDYKRNKVRNIIIPNLEEEFGESIEDSVFNLSELAKIDEEFLSNLTNDIFSKICEEKGDTLNLPVNEYLNFDKAIQYRLLRKVFEVMLGSKVNLSLKNIIEIDNLFSLESGKFIDNINGLKIRKSYDKVIFEKINFTEDKKQFIVLKKGISEINKKLKIKLEITNKSNSSYQSIFIPVELVKNRLIIRNRFDGDRMRPIGLNGSKKIKDIFIDKKIDRMQRDLMYLLADDEKIFWIIDVVRSEETKSISESGSYYKISIVK